MFTIRPTTSDDLASVDALLARAYPRLLKPDYPPSVLVTALPIIARANPALLGCGTYYLVLSAEGDLLGAGGWTRDREKAERGHVRHVVTDDRAVRRGVGRALIGHVLDTARAAGVTEMECWSTLTAVPFYERLGFRGVGPVDAPLAPGINFPSERMLQTL